MMDIVIENRQKALPVPVPALRRLVRGLAAKARVDLGEVVVILVDDKGIAPINEAAVGHHGATDVITMPCDPVPGVPASAEIVVDAEMALSQRPEDPLLELAFYLAHAFDHLSGHDDDTPAARTSMHRREWRWLRSLPRLTPSTI